MTGLTLASLAGGKIAFTQNDSQKLKIVIFWEDGFPQIDGLNLAKNLLQTALETHEIFFANAAELQNKLAEKDVDLFINPFGSAFPKNAWTEILKYLQTGGNFLNLGGKVFAVPIKKQNGAWKAEIEQVNYHKRLGILQYFDVRGAKNERFETNFETLKTLTTDKIETVFETYVKMANTAEFADESGSDGRREANLNALIFGFDAKNQRISAPIIQFERLKDEFAGGSWILANYKGEISAEIIKTLAKIAGFGAIDFSIKTDFASYRTNETPKLKIFADNPKIKDEIWSNEFSIDVFDDKNNSIYSSGMKVERIANQPVEIKIELDEKKFQSGFYRVKVSANLTKKSKRIEKNIAETGFWFFDEKLLQTGGNFTSDRHFLYRNGETFPVVGVTYMASDVHRRFLLEPNPAVWNADFAEMKSAGVNMIRTGIWTGWKLIADANGEPREEILRAFEAFILTAKKFDIPVIFTFFAFMPEIFGGKNAYLDPQSIEGQKRFLSAFAKRVKTAKDVVWDLINEPSFANPKSLWSCRPNYDEFEKAAWREWLKKRFAETDEANLIDILREKWRLTTEENPFDLPLPQDFDNVNIIANRRPLKASEFRLFAQDTFENWAREMSKTLKESGNIVQMVTVGQDEAGNGDSPSQQFHADALDFTCLHNWWSNDDLLWDNVVSKSPAKPNIIQETGVMFYEKTDGSAWRDEETVADLLERKMSLALSANGCGFIEWIWNTNPFMNIDNEAGIGFLRVDKTAKPELFAFQKIAKFANENRKYFRIKQDEKTLLVIPHSYQFLPRNFASEATKKAVRVFHYYCRRTLRSISEYNLAEILKEATPPNLIILPCPHVLNENAWQTLLELVKKGATLAMTGYFADDEYFIPRQRLKDLGSQSIYAPIPVSPNEKVLIDGKIFRTHFGNEKIQQVKKADFIQEYNLEFQRENGVVLWCPIPLELGENLEAVAAFYNFALKRAKLLPYFSLKNDIPSILVRPTEFQDAILYLVINENANAEFIELTHLPTATKIEFSLDGGKTNLIFIEKKTGKILSQLR